MLPSDIKLKYDTEIEVSEKAFNYIMNKIAGSCAGRKAEDGKYYIKPWIMNYSKSIKEAIVENPL
jgi:hypothetical protein